MNIDLPNATVTKTFEELRDLAHSRGYPDPTDPAFIGPRVEHTRGVVWHRQDTEGGGVLHNVLDYGARRLYMTPGPDGPLVYDRVAEAAEGGNAPLSLAAFGLRTERVREMEARHERLWQLLDRAGAAGGYNYHEQFIGQTRGYGLPPSPEIMRIVEKDVARIEAGAPEGADVEMTEPAWWWLPAPGRDLGYRLYRGRVQDGSGWRGPYPTRKPCRRDAIASTSTDADQRVGLFAELPPKSNATP